MAIVMPWADGHRARVQEPDILVQLLGTLGSLSKLPASTVPILLVTYNEASVMARQVHLFYGTLAVTCSETFVVIELHLG